MARAYGWNASLLFNFESVYGTSPAGPGTYTRLPFVSCDLGIDQPLIPDDILGLGRDPQDPIQDLSRVSGSITVPIDQRNIGFWLKLLLGNPTTTGTSPNYTHTFTSGSSVLPSASIDIGLPQVPSFALNKGVRANSLQIGMARSGQTVATIQLLGQNEVRSASAVDASPLSQTTTRFKQTEASISRNASALANIVRADVTFSNSLESIETLRADALVEAIDPGICSLQGNLSARFADTTLLTDASSFTPVDIDLLWSLSATRQMNISCHRAYLNRPRANISGPGGVELPFTFQCSYSSGAGEMMEVVLKNDVATY